MIDQVELNDIFSYLLLLPLKKAKKMVGHNMSIRVLTKDGVQQPGDSFYKDNRLNVEIANKKIVKILSIG